MVAIKLWIEYRFAALRDEDGSAAVEYGLLVGLLGVAMLATVSALGIELNQVFQGMTTKLQAVTP